ncbi:MAG TPA: ABC transporter ATP-binding protein [Bacteroidales bacterium]|nr:ABC transporter ATP-binding protein [Bacteroidales bacterium]
MKTIIQAEGLYKSYGTTRALNNVSFEVRESDIFGFIGPDGAGKTTLFRILATLLLPDKGSAKILGEDCITGFSELRKRIGYMPGRFSLYQDLSVEENLNFYATVFGTTVRANYDLIRDIYSHIEPFRKRLAGKLSGGMKQKLALSCALIHKPDLLILDEPTTGVDAVSRAEFWTMLSRLKEHRITILVSTPYMDEAMKCDRVALIQHGEILSVSSPSAIKDDFSGKLFQVRAAEKYKLLLALRDFPGTETAYPFGDSVHLTLTEGRNTVEVIEYLVASGLTDAEIEEGAPGIEDRFLQLMQHKEV